MGPVKVGRVRLGEAISRKNGRLIGGPATGHAGSGGVPCGAGGILADGGLGCGRRSVGSHGPAKSRSGTRPPRFWGAAGLGTAISGA
jgi:hypothetical protein